MRGPFKIKLMPCDMTAWLRAGNAAHFPRRRGVSHFPMRERALCSLTGLNLKAGPRLCELRWEDLPIHACKKCKIAMDHAKLCKLMKPYSEHSSALDLIREGSDKKQGPFSPPEPGSGRNSSSCECF